MAEQLEQQFNRLTGRLSRADIRESGDDTNGFPVTEAESEPPAKEDNGMVRTLICMEYILSVSI